MKSLLVLALVIIMGSGSTTNSRDLTDENNQTSQKVLIEADREFSKMSAEKGMYEAFDYFMDENAVMYREEEHPYVGRESIRPILSKNRNGTLTWEPSSAEIAESGELGYTLGRWEYAVKDSTGKQSTSFGYYVSIWKKQADGSWKYVFDSGVSGPIEEKKSEG